MIEKQNVSVRFKRQELEELMSDQNFAFIYADFEKYRRPDQH